MYCIYHSRDLDGWMSAAIVKFWFTIKYGIYEELTLIGWDYGDPIPELSPDRSIIMVDISFPVEEMAKLADRLIWIDHHISAIIAVEKAMLDLGGVRDPNYAACELAWKYLTPERPMPEIVRLLGRYDCFGHKGTSEELKVLQFQYGARSYISDVETAYFYLQNSETYHDIILQSGKDIYNYLCTEAKMIYKRAFPVMFDGFKFITVNTDRFNPINFGIDYHADGYDGAACFWFANGK